MSPDREDKTPAEPVIARRNTPGSFPAVKPPSDPPKIVEDEAAEAAHPRFDRAPLERTWDIAPPELVASTLRPTAQLSADHVATLRSMEAYARDAKKRAEKAEVATLTLHAENAIQHLGIETKLGAIATRIGNVEEQLPKATRSGRAWGFAIAAVSTAGMVLAGWFALVAARETAAATREQAAATREMIRASGQVTRKQP